MKQNCPHGTGKVLKPASWRGEYFAQTDRSYLLDLLPKFICWWQGTQVERHQLLAWKRQGVLFGKIKVGHSLPSVDGSDIPGQPPGACKWWVLFTTTFPSTGWFAGFMKINSSIWGLIYIHLLNEFSPIQLEVFGGIFWMINVWDEWSGPRVFPHHMEKKKTSLDANGEQMFHGEIGWPETSDTRGRFQGKMMVSSETVSLYLFFFLDKSQGASDLNFNPTSTKPLGWTRNMFFFEPTTWRQKKPEKKLSCLFQNKHGSMDF